MSSGCETTIRGRSPPASTEGLVHRIVEDLHVAPVPFGAIAEDLASEPAAAGDD